MGARAGRRDPPPRWLGRHLRHRREASFVAIVPAEEGGHIDLVQQYRYPVRARYWEFPEGSWKQTPGADPADVALGELREQTGLIAGRMMRTPGISLRRTAFPTKVITYAPRLAFKRGEAARDHEEQDLVARAFPLGEVERMIGEGGIKDAALWRQSVCCGSRACSELTGLIR